ncbi:MAG: DUF4832 domain-containing protein [Verrucomicrobia bacterium]|nr:DUF4832 domain-containing protein [Verrucomicrobiota bacterium]MBU1735092.1 DUF4832 domain-containing protein [Verrucomicrobiota bacterium]MBU1856392.1 DUF4832 domain-containing protein [Verrucomicrobiota bacterium]
MPIKTIVPKLNDAILHNPGCGILYLQRGGNKIRYEDIAPDSWFLRERLTDKIAFCIPWSVIEPVENEYCWELPDWEGCINSWIRNGFKVALMVRGMDTLGTFYDEGVPQWVFDAGAKYVDEPIQNYRGTYLLNNIPDDVEFPVRYPVYWDPVYLEKTEKLLAVMGQRYNGRPEVEYIGIGHMGRWGEMHIARHSPLQPWYNAGFSLKKYVDAHKRIIAIYRKAFPDTELSQELCVPCFSETPDSPGRFAWPDIAEIVEYLAENRIHLKYNGLGKSYEQGSSPYLDASVAKIMRRYYLKTKTAFENLALPQALQEGLGCKISYWHRGGESHGLGIAKVANNTPISDKKIYSFYRFFKNEYDALTLEDEKNIWRNMARQCGYRLELQRIKLPEKITKGQDFVTELQWRNSGSAPCYEKFVVKMALSNPVSGWTVLVQTQAPGVPCIAENWKDGVVINDGLKWTLPQDIPSGEFILSIGLQFTGRSKQMMQLPLNTATHDGLYKVVKILVE